jgi:hypothetical protein
LLVDMLSSAVFLPRVSGRAAKRALKRLRLLVAGRNWAALNSSGSQLIGVRYVQVGLEERENLTVTWNVSIAIRSLCVTLLAAILALVLVATLAEDADARKKRRKKGVTDFSMVFHSDGKSFVPPNRFDCNPGRPFKVPTRADWDPPNIQPPKPIDGYVCTAVGPLEPPGAAAIFDLNDVLERLVGSGPGMTPPPGPLASPDLFQCHWVPNAAGDRNAENFSCEFPENQQTCVFTMNELVATNVDEVDDHTGKVTLKEDLDTNELNDDDGLADLFLPNACHVDDAARGPAAAVPTAVPAGADAAGEGSAAWLFGLVLASSGATVGTVAIARRRFRNAS